MKITILKAFQAWGPGRKCVLCRALYALVPHPDPVDVPDEVADAAIAAGAADAADGIAKSPRKARRSK